MATSSTYLVNISLLPPKVRPSPFFVVRKLTTAVTSAAEGVGPASFDRDNVQIAPSLLAMVMLLHSVKLVAI